MSNKSRSLKNKKSEGGKRRGTRKMGKGPSDWNKKVMGVFREMRKKNPNYQFREALVEASKRKKAGKL